MNSAVKKLTSMSKDKKTNLRAVLRSAITPPTVKENNTVPVKETDTTRSQSPVLNALPVLHLPPLEQETAFGIEYMPLLEDTPDAEVIGYRRNRNRSDTFIMDTVRESSESDIDSRA